MPWQTVDTIPFRVAAEVAPARAAAIRAALLRRAVPVTRWLDGRLEPCATATLVEDGAATALLTAAHIFDRISVGDLAIPLPAENRVVALRSVRVQVVLHPRFDLCLLWIADRAVSARLRASWGSVPLRHWCAVAHVEVTLHAIAGYPSVNARRADGCVYVKPVVVFTRALAPGHYAYGWTAQRIDGIEIHTPELDGVSGAAVWAVEEDGRDEVACVLKPAAVQVAFQHGRHVRGEPIHAAGELITRRH
jgi:hypothetical protein